MSKKALITGISGQDGSYLAELLLQKGYEVHGLIRRTSEPLTEKIDHLYDQVQLHHGDLTDASSIHYIIDQVSPDEVYNLAAMSHVGWSYKNPTYTSEVNHKGFVHILEAVRTCGIDPKIYQACSSEMFGKVQEVPQKETTPFILCPCTFNSSLTNSLFCQVVGSSILQIILASLSSLCVIMLFSSLK